MRNEDQYEADYAAKTGLARGNSRKPKFGERMRGIWAGKKNPIRDGMYVETIRRRGRCNPGTYYRLTNGNGKFWEFPSKGTVFLAGIEASSKGAKL